MTSASWRRPISPTLAEFIRELIVAGTREGLAAARARGRIGGRPTVVTPDLLRAARDMLPNPESITSIARLLGVSPDTLYNHIPDLHELRTSRTRQITNRPRHDMVSHPGSPEQRVRAVQQPAGFGAEQAGGPGELVSGPESRASNTRATLVDHVLSLGIRSISVPGRSRAPVTGSWNLARALLLGRRRSVEVADQSLI